MEEISSLYFTKKKELANREFKYFDGADENCKAFNNEQMWNMEQVNSYNGFSGLDSRNIRGFHNASGCGSYNASGRTAGGPFSIGLTYDTPARQTGEPEECVGGCAPALGVGCPKGCQCWRKRGESTGKCVADGYARQTGGGDFVLCPEGKRWNGSKCVPIGERGQVNRKSRRSSADRISGNPVRGRRMNASGRSARRSGRDRISVAPVGGVGRQTAGGADCGQGCGQRGLGIVRRCQNKGCVCDDINSPSGTCVPVKGRVSSTEATARKMNFSHHSNFSAPARGFSPVERVFPYGTGNYFSGGSARSCGLDRR
jgi:hypothetical protein